MYGHGKNTISRDAHTPLGQLVILTKYIDANLYHDTITVRSVTGILRFINYTHIE